MIIKDYSSEVENFEEFLKDKLEAIMKLLGESQFCLKKYYMSLLLIHLQLAYIRVGAIKKGF